MKKITSLLFCWLIVSCSMTENGMVAGTPDYEGRDIEVNNLDLQVLLRANAMLPSEDHWSKDSSLKCADLPRHETSHGVDGYDLMGSKLSLYCALHLSSIETIGTYVHRLPALQEVRFTIADRYPKRWKVHRLADFNAHPKTTFTDVKQVLAVTIARVKQKIQTQKQNKTQ
jgi:hypothetical protein